MLNRLLVLLIMLSPGHLPAQATDGPCTSDAFKQFDFWLGTWNVYGPDGKLAGKNHISKRLNDCVVFEDWKSNGGNFAGQSFNTFDPLSGNWSQTWVDTTGATIYFSGTRRDNVMTLEGDRKDKDGKLYDRMSYTINTDGTVRQHWQQSRNGKDWTTVFDGLYRRQP